MRMQNDKGEIQISSEVFTTITGAVATRCFGVKGMAARSKKDGLVNMGGFIATNKQDWIIVDNGVNLAAVTTSIQNEVRYEVSKLTGAQVRAVDVYVDSMQIDE